MRAVCRGARRDRKGSGCLIGPRGEVIPEEVTIRFAVSGDLEFLEQYTYISTEILGRKIDWNEIVIATRADRPVGFLQLEYLWSLVPYIALIRVIPEFQRKGAGQKLLEFTGAFLLEKGHNTIYSSSQADEPEPQAWHRRAGFEECGMIAGINKGIGEVFFRKRL